MKISLLVTTHLYMKTKQLSGISYKTLNGYTQRQIDFQKDFKKISSTKIANTKSLLFLHSTIRPYKERNWRIKYFRRNWSYRKWRRSQLMCPACSSPTLTWSKTSLTIRVRSQLHPPPAKTNTWRATYFSWPTTNGCSSQRCCRRSRTSWVLRTSRLLSRQIKHKDKKYLYILRRFQAQDTNICLHRDVPRLLQPLWCPRLRH